MKKHTTTNQYLLNRALNPAQRTAKNIRQPPQDAILSLLSELINIYRLKRY